MLERISFPSVSDAKHVATTGSGFDVTAQDFDIADEIYGSDIASLKGKTVKQKGYAPDRSDAEATVPIQKQTLSVDIMFIDEAPTLIGVVSPLGLTLVYGLKQFDTTKPSRSAASVLAGITQFTTALAQGNYTAVTIRCDGDGAIGKLTPYLNSIKIEVDVCAAGSHIPIVERRIRVIKESPLPYIRPPTVCPPQHSYGHVDSILCQQTKLHAVQQPCKQTESRRNASGQNTRKIFAVPSVSTSRPPFLTQTIPCARVRMTVLSCCLPAIELDQ